MFGSTLTKSTTTREKTLKRWRWSAFTQVSIPLAAVLRADRSDHCIEYLRQSLMCKPDLSLVTFRWALQAGPTDNPLDRYPKDIDKSMHECAKWDSLSEWMEGRALGLLDAAMLRKPTTAA